MFHHFLHRNVIARFRPLLGEGSVEFSKTTKPSLPRFLSTASSPNSTVDYLVNSCGLSPELALKASEKIILKSTTKPDSVLSLFRNYGITEFQISRIITATPSLILSDPVKNLKPKLEFLNSIGISGSNLGNILSRDTNILRSNLAKRIVPSINFLRGFVYTDANIAVVLNRSGRGIFNGTERLMGPNIAILRDHGVPESHISKFVITRARSLCNYHDRFNEMVLTLKKMGVSPLSLSFIRCLIVLLAIKKPLWDAKVAVFKSFGWSEEEVLSAFKKEPFMLASSAKKISSSLDFFMKNLNWTSVYIAKVPCVLRLSLEKRVIPRCFVLRMLFAKDLIIKDGIGSALIVPEDKFLRRYVIKYQHQVPELLQLYKSKTSTLKSKMGSAV